MSIGMTRLAMTRLACIAEAFMVPSSRAAALTLPAVGRAGRRFGFGVGCENRLGCQPTSLLGMQGPLVGVGEGSISLRRWLTAYRVLRKAGALMRQSGSVRALP